MATGDFDSSELSVSKLRNAVKQLKELDAMAATSVTTTGNAGMAGSVFTTPYWTTYGAVNSMPQQTKSPTAPNVFNRVQEQVARHKRNVITPAVMKAKREQFMKEVEEEITGFDKDPEFKAWAKKQIEYRVKTAYKRFLNSADFTKLCNKAIAESMKKGVDINAD